MLGQEKVGWKCETTKEPSRAREVGSYQVSAETSRGAGAQGVCSGGSRPVTTGSTARLCAGPRSPARTLSARQEGVPKQGLSVMTLEDGFDVRYRMATFRSLTLGRGNIDRGSGMRKRKLLFGIAAPAVAAVAVGLCLLLRPASPSRTTLENARRVRLEMNRAEVMALLGPPGDYTTGPIARSGEPAGLFRNPDEVGGRVEYWTSDTVHISMTIYDNNRLRCVTYVAVTRLP
jgi:hypothetical protein